MSPLTQEVHPAASRRRLSRHAPNPARLTPTGCCPCSQPPDPNARYCGSLTSKPC